jgi:multidrug efflux pump subunit AcrA (membrane-fusion protein)
MARLEAQVARAQALRDAAALEVERTVVRAPFAGVITATLVSPGDRVRPGDPLLGMYDTGAREVRAQIPMRHLVTVRAALAAGADLTGSARVGRRQQATLHLARLAGRVMPGSGGVDGLFGIGPDGDWLTLGQTVEIDLRLPPLPDAFPIPVTALYGTNRVYLARDGRLLGVQVESLGRTSGPAGSDRLLVAGSGLTVGDKLVTTQLPNAVDGLRVRVTD